MRIQYPRAVYHRKWSYPLHKITQHCFLYVCTKQQAIYSKECQYHKKLIVLFPWLLYHIPCIDFRKRICHKHYSHHLIDVFHCTNIAESDTRWEIYNPEYCIKSSYSFHCYYILQITLSITCNPLLQPYSEETIIYNIVSFVLIYELIVYQVFQRNLDAAQRR